MLAGPVKEQQLRNGKMSPQEQKAMEEINTKEEKINKMAGQIADNLEYLLIRAKMLGEEIDAQDNLVLETTKEDFEPHRFFAASTTNFIS